MKFTRWIARSSLAAILFASASVMAQPYYVRGSFNGWDMSTPMTDNGGGFYSATFTGTPGTRFDFKVANTDWSQGWPGDNCRTLFNPAGSATVYFRAGSFADGWNPPSNRVGYIDPLQFGWEVMGSFNGWASPAASLTAMGGGVYSGTLLVPTAGTYNFKFREAGSWDIAIGDDFSNWNHDSTVITANPNTTIQFQLDLPNGRWSTTVVPEPTTLSLCVGAVLLFAIRRKSNQV